MFLLKTRLTGINACVIVTRNRLLKKPNKNLTLSLSVTEAWTLIPTLSMFTGQGNAFLKPKKKELTCQFVMNSFALLTGYQYINANVQKIESNTSQQRNHCHPHNVCGCQLL